MPLPTYEEMRKHYPNYPAGDVYKLIGGKVYQLYLENPTGYANACALRLSRSLNYAGHAVISSSAYYMQKGGDNKNYIFRVRDIIKYVKNNFSLPDYTFLKNNDNTITRKQKGIALSKTFTSYENALQGLKGIIVFHVTGWGDASGHCTLFSYANSGNINNKCEDYHCYFEHEQIDVKTPKVELWVLK